LRGGQLQASERLQESELRSQELQELQNTRARSLSENQDQRLPGKILAKLPDSLAPELLQLLTPEFLNVLGGQAQVSEKFQEFRRNVSGSAYRRIGDNARLRMHEPRDRSSANSNSSKKASLYTPMPFS
jgi:hypothetical protein